MQSSCFLPSRGESSDVPLPMAEKSSCRALSSSIHSEDLLSDMELLPASAPTTPVQQVPGSQPATPYASKVTAQLYASLHQSRQAEAQARSHLENQHSLGLAREREAPEVDLDTLAEELSLRLSASVEASKSRKARTGEKCVGWGGTQEDKEPIPRFPSILQGAAAAESHHISEMENVRCHLQSMLQKSRDAAHGDAAALGTFERKDDDSFESDSTSALLNARPLQEISPPGSLMGFEELFPRYTSLRLGQLQERASYANSHLLKDSLDKEQARRKHCERHIQTLQNRILELQQQLAVATSADKKKDSMIEQLDKTLAKVVEGWNRHEAERTAALQRLQVEKESAEQALERHKEKLSGAEGQLEQASSALSREQQAAGKYRKEKEVLEEEKAALSRSLEAERLRVRSLEADWDLERRQQEALRSTLEEQQRDWAQRERKLEEQYQALQEESQAQLEKEKAVTQQETQKSMDAQRVLASVQSEVQRLEAELEVVRRERDNLKMEISLIKARYEAQKVKLESELKVALEQRVTERLAEVHEDSVRQMSAVREQHRKQLLEMSGHHERELAGQLDQFRSDLAEREERQRQLTADYEHRLSKQQEEILELRAVHRRLEVQRAEMVNQFQAMMQAHWNEALRLLAGSNVSSQPAAKAPQQDAPADLPASSEPGFLQLKESLTKTSKGLEPLGCSQGAGDCEGPAWTPAVPLQPIAQRSSLQAPSEGPEKSTQDAYHPVAPLPPDMGRLSSEFSRILNCSLLSHQGFQPLEPQVDNTVAGAGLSFHLENLAERPFTDEADETTAQAVGSDREPLWQSGLEPRLRLPPADLNHYMRLLWDRTAYEGRDQKLEGFSMESRPHSMNQTQFGPSLSYHDWSTAFLDPSQLPASTIRIQPPSSAAVQKTKVPLPKSELSSSSLETTSPPVQNAAHEGGILSPKQMAEVSRLLKQCQAKGRPVPSTEELYKYLRGISQNGTESKSDGTLQMLRNLDPRLTEATKKEVASVRRVGSSGLGREKLHSASKAGKRTSSTLVPSARASRGGGVWR